MCLQREASKPEIRPGAELATFSRFVLLPHPTAHICIQVLLLLQLVLGAWGHLNTGSAHSEVGVQMRIRLYQLHFQRLI